jgi:short-subunit dehydrogenase
MAYTLITGASSGIGEVFARRLAEKKHDLVLVARSEKKLHELCDELMFEHKIIAHYICLDLSEPGADARLFEETEKHGFEIDWLINNAGFGSMGDFAELPLERELEMVDLNVRAVVALTHRYLPQMRERKCGTIINTSSTISFQPLPYMATYAASKAFVTAFTESIAAENRPFGIQITALCPGVTETNFFAAAKINDPFKVKGMQTPEQVVDAALRGVERKKTLVISGAMNKFVAYAATITPNSLITRVIGNALRGKLSKKQ